MRQSFTLTLWLTCALAFVQLPANNGAQLYALSTGHTPNKMGDVVRINVRDGSIKLVGSLTGHPGYTVPRDIVRAADGKHYYAIELEIGDGWAKSYLMTIEARTLKVERSVLLGEAFDGLVIDRQSRLLAARWSQQCSSLVCIDPQTGSSTELGVQGRTWQFTSVALDTQTGKLLGLGVVMSTGRFALVRINPATGLVEASVDLDFAEHPSAMAMTKDGKALLATDTNLLYEADPTTGKTLERAKLDEIVLVGMHADL